MIAFESRELKPYVEYVREDRLREGSIYFRVTYLDDIGLVPRLEPFVFLGRNLTEGDQDEVYFQDAASYVAGHRVGEIEESTDLGDAFIFSGPADTGHVMEFREALETLMKCELRRQEAAPLIGD